VRQVAIGEFELEPGKAAYDLAFAVRVGALDGRRELMVIAEDRTRVYRDIFSGCGSCGVEPNRKIVPNAG
jgi:hypothetical protein